MKVKYLLSALCLAALAVGCEKESQSVDGLRISVTQGTATRTALDADGLNLKWESGDKLLLCAAGQSTRYTLTIDESSISQDGLKADFVSSIAIPAGDYRLTTEQVSADGTIPYAGVVTVTHDTKHKLSGGLSNVHMFSEVVTLSQQSTSVWAYMQHASALLELPVTLTGNESGADVSLKSITLASKNNSNVFPAQYTLGESGLTAGEASLSSMQVTFTDAPVLTQGTAYKVYIAIPALALPGMSVTVSTSAGDYTFDKAAKTFSAGHRYTVSGLDIQVEAAASTVSSQSEWDAAVSGATQPVSITLSDNVTLTSTATIPTQAVTVSGPYTLTFDVQDVKSSPTLDANYDVIAAGSPEEAAKGNDKRELPVSLTLTQGASLAVNNGCLYAKDLTLGDGSQVSAAKGRLVLSGTLSVAQDATATIASGTIASCNVLDIADGALTVNGRLYYGSLGAARAAAPANAVSKADAQLPYSGFDDWFTKSVSAFTFVKGTADLVGVSSNTDEQNVWGNGNGNNSGSGGLALSGENPTTKDAGVKVGGAYSLKMYSKYVKISITNKFAAGNLFTGYYTGTSGTTGAKMNFGTPYTEKPVALTGYYRYNTGKINYINSKASSDRGDEDDRCDIYVALSKKLYNVDTTNESTYPGGTASTDLAGDENIVAYGRITSSQDTGEDFKRFRIELTYKNADFNPAEVTHILVVASSSAEGAQFNGSDQAVLWLDELQLEF